MLVVKVELHHAVTGDVTELGEMRIVNDGTGDVVLGNYDVRTEWGGDAWTARVERYPRIQGKFPFSKPENTNVWPLVHAALQACFPKLRWPR